MDWHDWHFNQNLLIACISVQIPQCLPPNQSVVIKARLPGAADEGQVQLLCLIPEPELTRRGTWPHLKRPACLSQLCLTCLSLGKTNG